MKFCPYCGVSLPGSAVSFCPECGEKLPGKKEMARTHQTADRKPPRHPSGSKRRKQPQPGKTMEKAQIKQPCAQDEGYDGYYNDVPPVDAGQLGEPMDPELVKRIVLLLAGTVGIITLAAVLMSLL